MTGYQGNKTLLPLIPAGASPLQGDRPMLCHILSELPPGPKAAVVHHKKDDVMAATRDFDCAYCRQPILNGTGGALLAARQFIEMTDFSYLIVTMGDVPLVRRTTYDTLTGRLGEHPFVVLGFRPESKKQYGVLEIQGDRVVKITEWAYWREYSEEWRNRVHTCNSGIYAARKEVMRQCMTALEAHPHRVTKQINGRPKIVEEFFITDLVAYLSGEGLTVGYVTVENEDEVMGVDDLPALRKAQDIFKKRDRPT
ncbi:MAG: NTP transferase domain-containing protein [Deltaproteobacteria bacterium]|nr:NTP transferase domain-containing protein [Deltaproteobacteria bacterium]